MRMRFILVFLVAIGIGFATYLLIRWVAFDYIEEIYIGSDRRKVREDSYVENLQEFIDENGVTEDTTSKLSEWAKSNKYVYLIVYKGDKELYTSDDLINFPPEVEQKPEEKPQNPGSNPTNPDENPTNPDENPTNPDENPTNPDENPTNPDENPTNPDENPTNPDANPTNPDENPTNPDINPDSSESQQGNNGNQNGEAAPSTDGTQQESENKPTRDPGGFTVSYPSRDQLFEYAKKNALHLIKLTDDSELFVSLTEFTEYLYYDITNISGIGMAVLVVLIILILYSQMVASRIIHLGNEVDKVACGDITHEIKSNGGDEIAKLSQNVNDMRVSMIANFEKEKEALDANAALITSMSHDIRTPLTVLLGYIDVMKKKAEGDEDMRGYLKAAESTALRLKKLSDDMFGYFLVFGSRGADVDMDNYDAATIIDQMLLEHITLMRESGCTVEFSPLNYEALAGKELHTDAPKLMRIFDNVFSNINKYADKSRPITVEVTESDEDLTVKVSNAISKNNGKVESNKIGLKTCEKLGEYLGADFSYEQGEDLFIATLKLKLYEASDVGKNAKKDN